MLTTEHVAAFKTAVGTAHWDLSYTEFCKRAGFAEDAYAELLWVQWQKLAMSLSRFDTNTLSKIIDVDAQPAADPAAQPTVQPHPDTVFIRGS